MRCCQSRVATSACRLLTPLTTEDIRMANAPRSNWLWSPLELPSSANSVSLIPILRLRGSR